MSKLDSGKRLVIAVVLTALVVSGIWAALGTRSPTQTRSEVATVTLTIQAKLEKPDFKIVVVSAGDSPSIGNAIQEVAVMKFMRSWGYTVEFQYMGVRASSDAFVAKKIHFWSGTFSEIAPAIVKGAGIIQIMPDRSLQYNLVARRDIKTLKDLEGRSIGIARPGAISEVIPRWMLKSVGADPERVKWIALGGSHERLEALIAGRIDAGLMYYDFAVDITSKMAELRILASVADITSSRIRPDLNAVFVYRDFAEKYPGIVKEYLKARIAAAVWSLNHKDEFIKYVAERVDGAVKPERLVFWSKVYDGLKEKGELVVVDTSEAEQKVIMGMAVESGVIKEPLALSKWYEPKYLDEVLEEMGK